MLIINRWLFKGGHRQQSIKEDQEYGGNYGGGHVPHVPDSNVRQMAINKNIAPDEFIIRGDDENSGHNTTPKPNSYQYQQKNRNWR